MIGTLDWPRKWRLGVPYQGSETSPARVTIRCNCRNRARYKKAVRRIAEIYWMTNRPQSEVQYNTETRNQNHAH